MEMESKLTYYWIVYLTTNLVNKFIYIGVHKTTTPFKFDQYLGCGCYANLPSSYNSAKTKFALAVQQFGPKNFQRKTLKVFDNEDDAYALEAELVNEDFLKRKDIYNMVLGGKCGLTRIIPCYAYTLDGKFCNEYESIKHAALSVNRGSTTIGRAIIEKIKAADLFWSVDKFEQLDLSLYKTDSNKVPIYQYAITGEYLCEYESESDAENKTGISKQNICRGMKLGYAVGNFYFSTEKKPQFSQAKHQYVQYKAPVYQYELNGKFIAEFESATAARKELGIKTDIGAAIRKGSTCGGFQWSYEKLPEMPNIENKYIGKARKVAVYTLNNELVETFDTVKECMQKYSSVKKVLQGKQKTGNGHLFEYID